MDMWYVNMVYQIAYCLSSFWCYFILNFSPPLPDVYSLFISQVKSYFQKRMKSMLWTTAEQYIDSVMFTIANISVFYNTPHSGQPYICVCVLTTWLINFYFSN